jgi:ligand-binding SRPBCC domain-containing protein
MTYVLVTSEAVQAPLGRVFAFFAEPMNLSLITPPWLHFTLVHPFAPVMAVGLRLTYRIRPLIVPQTWVSQITAYEPPHRFVDEQRQGPYAYWHHEHTFRSVPDGTEVTDRVTYQLPLGLAGRVAHAIFVRQQLRSIFAFRSRAIRAALDTGGRASGQGGERTI